MKPNKFWVTAIGRSGTRKLAKILGEVAGHYVGHEETDPRHMTPAHAYSDFPIHRFMGRHPYGECHGKLRYSLSHNRIGLEREVPNRAIVYRDLRKVITSWMNQDQRERYELGAVTYEICWQWQNLELYCRSDRGCPIFDFDNLMAGGMHLNLLFYSLGLEIGASPLMTEEKVGETPEHRRTFQWDVDAETIFRRVNERLWKPYGISSEIIKY